MSWDVILVRTKSNLEEYDQIKAQDIIGFTKKEVLDEILSIADTIGAEASDLDTNYVHLRSNKWSVEFDFAIDQAPYDELILEIRGSIEPSEALLLLCRNLNATIYDMSTDAFWKPDGNSGFGDWKNLCEKINKNFP